MISCTSMSAEYSKHREVQSENLAFVSNEQDGIQKDVYYQVTKVVDGDTFWIDNLQPGGLKIRFIGIDAPESRNAFKRKSSFMARNPKNT